jgi:hypothetical protein
MLMLMMKALPSFVSEIWRVFLEDVSPDIYEAGG